MSGIYEKLSKIQAEIKVPKNLHNSFGGYNYRSAEAIQEAFKPYAEKYGVMIIMTQQLLMIGNRYYIEARATLYDVETLESIETTAYAREAESKKGMDESQITGSAASYAKKYALSSLLFLDDTKDADSDEYTQEQSDQEATAAQKKTIETICKKHKIDVEQLCRINGLEWKQLTDIHAGKLLNSLKQKFGDE